jgi:hypothetical protein
MTWSANNTWKHSPGSIITSETRLHHSGSIVTNKGLNILSISHLLLNVKVEREWISERKKNFLGGVNEGGREE